MIQNKKKQKNYELSLSLSLSLKFLYFEVKKTMKNSGKPTHA